MNSSGDEEDTGPSVDAVEPEERIAARRLRITRRVDAARRAERGEDPSKKKDVKEELSKSRKQIEESRLRLTKLGSDGTELVTNIRVAGDSRENSRRIEEEDGRRQRKDRLEAEAKAGAERFEEITKKWESALQKEIPQDLHEMLMQQKQACDAMIDEKNKLINDFQMELKAKDDHYVKDLKKQAEDIDLMIERMEEQIKNLTKAYREELNQIEKAFLTERNELLENNKKKWGSHMGTRREKEEEYMKLREKRVDDYEQQLQHLRIQDSEEYNMVKIKLETDVQILEQQLQQMRATYQLNQEKLEYNFQVLKKRDEENTITKSQQKRKITRMQDVLNNLRSKLAKQEKTYKDENVQLTEDYKRVTEQFKELQKKSKHFMSTDVKKFTDIWCMNEEELKELVGKVLEQDKIIHQQQLGLEWGQPDLSFMENIGPLVTDPNKPQQVSATQLLQEVMSAKGSDDDNAVFGKKTSKVTAKTIKRILELLCDESGFLIESKLNKLLVPLEKDEQSLMKLDAIFVALGIETEDDIHQLANYFLPHLSLDASSPLGGEGSQKYEKHTKTEEESSAKEPGSKVTPRMTDGATGHTGYSRKTSQVTHSEMEQSFGEEDDGDSIDAEIRRVTGKIPEVEEEDEEGESPRSSKSSAVQDLIHPNEVLKALRKFVDDNRQPQKDERSSETPSSPALVPQNSTMSGREKSSKQFKIAALEERDDSQDAAYWRKYTSVISENKERLWDGLIEGLEKYSDTLTARANTITEADGLRQQNAELRMLLHQYINSKVNQELEIPPTRVLQMELNQS